MTKKTSFDIPLLKKPRTRQPTTRTIKKTALKILIILGLAFLCTTFLFPVLWMVSNSLKNQEQVYAQISSIWTFLPATLDVLTWFESYGALFSSFQYFGRSILNSVVYCSIAILGVILVNSFAGYALSRFRFPGSKVMTTIIIILMIVPIETSVVPLYTILYRLGLLTQNLSVVGYLIPGFCSLFYIFMFRQFFMSIPMDIEEAARIDGCSRAGVYFKMILPLSKPIIATVAIFTFMGQWNEYIFAQLMFVDPSMQPLQVFLQLVNTYNPRDISVVMAALTFSTIPIVLVYIFAQKYIIEGVAYTGLK